MIFRDRQTDTASQYILSSLVEPTSNEFLAGVFDQGQAKIDWGHKKCWFSLTVQLSLILGLLDNWRLTTFLFPIFYVPVQALCFLFLFDVSIFYLVWELPKYPLSAEMPCDCIFLPPSWLPFSLELLPYVATHLYWIFPQTKIAHKRSLQKEAPLLEK